MKIFTEVFQKNGKLLNGLIEKGNQLYESIYFDFKNSYAYILTSKINARISFVWEKCEDEYVDNFLISLESFIIICNLKDSYTFCLNENSACFTNEKENYEFPYFKDDIDISNFDKVNNENLIILNKYIHNTYLPKLIRYADSDDTSNLCGIFIRNNKLVATDKNRLYEVNLDLLPNKGGVKFDNLSLPLFLAKIICLNSEAEVKYNSYDNFIHLTIDSCIDLLCVSSTKIDLPIQALDSIVYNHETYFIINKNDLFKHSQVLDYFLKDVVNQRVYCSIKENEIELNVIDNNKIKKFIKLQDVSKDIIGLTFWVSFNNLKNAFSDFKNDILKVQIKSDSPVINISSENEINHIILVRLRG